MGDHIPQIHIILHVHCGICVVRSILEEKVLHETILPFCLDSRCSSHCCNSKLLDNNQHFPWNDLVHCSSVYDSN